MYLTQDNRTTVISRTALVMLAREPGCSLEARMAEAYTIFSREQDATESARAADNVIRLQQQWYSDHIDDLYLLNEADVYFADLMQRPKPEQARICMELLRCTAALRPDVRAAYCRSVNPELMLQHIARNIRADPPCFEPDVSDDTVSALRDHAMISLRRARLSREGLRRMMTAIYDGADVIETTLAYLTEEMALGTVLSLMLQCTCCFTPLKPLVDLVLREPDLAQLRRDYWRYEVDAPTEAVD